MFGIDLQTRHDKHTLLETLKGHRAAHMSMVTEANVGYLEKASVALAERLDAIKSGKVVSLEFELPVPRDFTSGYDSLIAMLTGHTENSVNLSAQTYKKLVEDNWEWAREFAGSNARYSGTVGSWAASKGL